LKKIFWGVGILKENFGAPLLKGEGFLKGAPPGAPFPQKPPGGDLGIYLILNPFSFKWGKIFFSRGRPLN